MNKKWAYFMAVLFLLVVRFGVLDTNYDEYLASWGYPNVSGFITMLKESAVFNTFVGSWSLVVFVVVVVCYWGVTQDDGLIPMQFLILPIAYIPFSIIGEILSTAQFHFSYLWVHPLMVLPFGYLYVSFWTIFIWLLEKIRLISN